MMDTIHPEDVFENSDDLQVYLFNVGQGDHILLKFPNNEYGLIDFFYDSASHIPEPPALTWFKTMKKRMSPKEFSEVTISFFCISHTDKDHIRGICETIRWFDEHGVYIREFWLGAARDEAELIAFLQHRVGSLIKTMDINRRLALHHKIESFQKNVGRFFNSFEKWQRGGFISARHRTEPTGKGEYLVDIRSLRRPCSVVGTAALNIGPLGHHLTDYINNINLDIVEKFLGVEDSSATIDKNAMSHILRLTFGENQLFFGGDTHRDVWEDCLRKYQDSSFDHLRDFGPNRARFVKVSHHGSGNSSSEPIWKGILDSDSPVFLGISAGRHHGYKHPHSQTMTDIRQSHGQANILATNVCGQCLGRASYVRELHQWYDDAVRSSKHYAKEGRGSREIDRSFGNHNLFRGSISTEEPGLLAYVFVFPYSGHNIQVKAAMSNLIQPRECFYVEHDEKLCGDCQSYEK